MPHPLTQVIPRSWGTDDGVAQLRASGLQKGELLNFFSVLPLSHLSGPMLSHKLALKEGDLPDETIVILTSRG
jgi:hypothetical protein